MQQIVILASETKWASNLDTIRLLLPGLDTTLKRHRFVARILQRIANRMEDFQWKTLPSVDVNVNKPRQEQNSTGSDTSDWEKTRGFAMVHFGRSTADR